MSILFQFCITKTAVNYTNLYGCELASNLERNLYEDDIVKSLQTVDEATEVIHNIKELCSKWGFNLTKFTCNKDEELKYTKKTYVTDKHWSFICSCTWSFIWKKGIRSEMGYPNKHYWLSYHLIGKPICKKWTPIFWPCPPKTIIDLFYRCSWLKNPVMDMLI